MRWLRLVLMVTALVGVAACSAGSEAHRFERAELSAIECVYRRPWGEPWYAFRDLWFESNGTAYLLSFHAYALDGFGEAMAAIVDSFQLAPGE